MMNLMMSVLVLIASVLAGCVSEPATQPGGAATTNAPTTNDPVSDRPMPSWSPSLIWDIQTTPGTYDMPESIVFLVVDGTRIPVGDGPGLVEMTDEQRSRFRVPASAEWAAAGYYAGFGINMMAEIRNDSILVSRAIWDEQADPALAWNYQIQAGLALKDLQETIERGGPSEAFCFEGQNGTTTSRFKFNVAGGVVSGQHNRTIADHDMGYFTSAESTGQGVLVGTAVYVSLVTKIEYDVQKAVEMWSMTPQGLLYNDFVYPPCASPPPN